MGNRTDLVATLVVAEGELHCEVLAVVVLRLHLREATTMKGHYQPADEFAKPTIAVVVVVVMRSERHLL